MEDIVAREINAAAEEYRSLVHAKGKSAKLRLAVASELRQAALRTRQYLRPRGDLGRPADAIAGQDVLKILSEAISDSDPRIRVLAIGTLSDLAGESSVAVFVAAVTSLKGRVVRAALEALGQVGGPEAVNALVRVAKAGGDVDTRFAALAALERLTAKEAQRQGSPLQSVHDGALEKELSAMESNIAEVPFLRMKAAEIRELLDVGVPTTLSMDFKRRKFLKIVHGCWRPEISGETLRLVRWYETELRELSAEDFNEFLRKVEGYFAEVPHERRPLSVTDFLGVLNSLKDEPCLGTVLENG